MNKIGAYGCINSKTSLGEAMRRNIVCLNIAGLDTYTFDFTPKDQPLYYPFLPKQSSKYDFKTKYFHLSLPLYDKLKNITNIKTKKNKKIGFFIWDSTKLPPN